MNYCDQTKPKIYHQGIDTLRTSHILMHEDNYTKYTLLLSRLANLKDEAILANAGYEFENGISFEFDTYGKFFIRPKGQGRYRYVIYNQDIEIFFSTVLLSANNYTTPQIVVDYRSKYLSLLGHEKAYAVVCAMLSQLLGTTEHHEYGDIFNTQLMRIDLCTDVGGIDYTPIDKYRFQTNFKNNGHIEFKEHLQFNRLTGFSFGKGDYMMRIYNKRHQLNNDSSKLWLVSLWVNNGYDENIRPTVWRHEVQMRRPYLKRFRREVVTDEVRYFFDMLPSLWSFAFNKVEFVDITEKQAIKIMNAGYSPEALKKLFYRTKKDNPSIVWDMASHWQGIKAPHPEDYGQYRSVDQAVAKRFFKAFISTAYKASNGDPLNVLKIMDLVQDELETNHGYTLHDYGENKLLSNFIDNAQYITNNGFTVDRDYKALAGRLYWGMFERFVGIDDPLFNSNERRLAEMFGKSVFELRETINGELSMIDYETDIKPVEEYFYEFENDLKPVIYEMETL